MFEDRVLEDFEDVEKLHKAGINEFIFDFSALNAKYVPILLDKFLRMDKPCSKPKQLVMS